jgi:predicted RNase H-like nuclease (RuvC/YqgF family)
MNNEGPPAITVTKLPLSDDDDDDERVSENRHRQQRQQQQHCTNCTGTERQLVLLAAREKSLQDEVERLREKIKAKNKRHKSRLEQLEEQHAQELRLKDQEIAKLQAQLEKHTTTMTLEEKLLSKKPNPPSRRTSWSEKARGRRKSCSEHKRQRSNSNSRRGMIRTQSISQLIEVPRTFVIGGVTKLSRK